MLALSAPATAAASSRQDRVERSVIHRIDAVRVAHGLPPLRSSRRLARAADRHTLEMAWRGRLGHDSTSGSLVSRIPGSLVGETLARMPRGTRPLSRTVVIAWLRSPPHRAVLLDPRLRRIGVARRLGPGGWYFTADLAG